MAAENASARRDIHEAYLESLEDSHKGWRDDWDEAQQIFREIHYADPDVQAEQRRKQEAAERKRQREHHRWEQQQAEIRRRQKRRKEILASNETPRAKALATLFGLYEPDDGSRYAAYRVIIGTAKTLKERLFEFAKRVWEFDDKDPGAFVALFRMLSTQERIKHLDNLLQDQSKLRKAANRLWDKMRDPTALPHMGVIGHFENLMTKLGPLRDRIEATLERIPEAVRHTQDNRQSSLTAVPQQQETEPEPEPNPKPVQPRNNGPSGPSM